MLRYAEDIHKTVKGLGAIVDNQAPAIRLLVKNWPITLLAGIAYGSRVTQLYKKGDLTAFAAFRDAGFLMAPIVVFFTLQKLGRENDEGLLDGPGPSQPTPVPIPQQLIQ